MEYSQRHESECMHERWIGYRYMTELLKMTLRAMGRMRRRLGAREWKGGCWAVGVQIQWAAPLRLND